MWLLLNASRKGHQRVGQAATAAIRFVITVSFAQRADLVTLVLAKYALHVMNIHTEAYFYWTEQCVLYSAMLIIAHFYPSSSAILM